MTNAEKFKEVFGLYATEFWAKSEKDMLEWLNTPYNNVDVTYYNNGDLISFVYKKDESNYCRSCPNNPKNGGSGICNCTLGSPVIYC